MTNRPFMSEQEKAEWKIFFEKLHFLCMIPIVGIQLYAAGVCLSMLIEFLFILAR